jgi:hypothetical protein
VVDDLHDRARVHPGQVAQELEPEGRLVVERVHHGDDIAGRDPHLRLVVALTDRTGQLLAEAGLQPGLEASVQA